MGEELKYSSNALLNKDIFFENDINFYIEDREKEYRYASILKQLFNVKIESIFALDGKNNLKRKYKELKDEDKLYNSFFIADLDFDFLLKRDIVEDPHFIYLEKSEIENYILDKNAISNFLMNELKCMPTKAENLLKYDEWLEKTNKKLYELFLIYFIVQKLNIGEKNTSDKAYKYFDEEGQVIDKEIKKYYETIEDKLIEIGENLDENICEAKKLIKKCYNNDFSKFIKGKYILVGLRKYLSYIISKKLHKRKCINEEFFTNWLFNFFDKKDLFFLRDRVKECIKSNGNYDMKF